MASQTPKVPLKGDSREPKRGIKNPTIYAGTIVVLVIVIIAFVFFPWAAAAPPWFRATAAPSTSAATRQADHVQPRFLHVPAGARAQRSFPSAGVTQDNYQLLAYQVYRGAFERTVLRMAAIDTATKAGDSVTEDWLDTKVAAKPGLPGERQVLGAALPRRVPRTKSSTCATKSATISLYRDYFTTCWASARAARRSPSSRIWPRTRGRSSTWPIPFRLSRLGGRDLGQGPCRSVPQP